MANFVISDHHFYHHKIIEYCNRPFQDVVEMNEHMIACWNSVVQPADVVYYVGDFAFGDPSLRPRILKRLAGHEKHLIQGNHDGSYKACREVGWTTVQRDLRYTTADGHRILMQHRPWNDDVPPPGIELIIHGHIHNYPARRAHININVSCEVLNYTPVLLDDLVRRHMRVMGWERRLTDHGTFEV